MKKKAAKIPYEGYELPPSSERGGKFIDLIGLSDQLRKLE